MYVVDETTLSFIVLTSNCCPIEKTINLNQDYTLYQETVKTFNKK